MAGKIPKFALTALIAILGVTTKNTMALSRRSFFTRACASAVSIVLVSSLKKWSTQAADDQSVDMKTLSIYFNQVGKHFTVRTELGEKSHFYRLSENAEHIIYNLSELYLDLNLIYSPKSETIDRIKWLGSQILSPLALWIDRCEEIQFIIPEDFVRFPFDILQYRELPLFLQKPITYGFSQVCSTLKFSEDWSALIISDRTADPENGAALVKDILADSIYYDIRDLTLDKLNSIPPKDLILISAHGLVSSNRFNGEDHIALGEESILPAHLSRLTPKLIYLDSCELGVSNEFIQSLRKAKTNYYIAPILSNEAGNSSTKTIKLFFESLKEGLSPSLALFHTRTQLYKHFQVSDDYKRLMWRAFPFRVYQLN